MKRIIVLMSVILLLFITGIAHGANLIRNGGFEEYTGIPGSQGYLPSDWVQTSGISPGADTYDTTGVYGIVPTLAGGWSHFTDVPAYEGTRWVAGFAWVAPAYGESFGQLLTTPLTAGMNYKLSAALYSSADYLFDGGVGGYDVYLAPDASLDSAVKIGTLGATTPGSTAWEAFTVDFTAPDNAIDLPYFILNPFSTATYFGSYPGIDAVSLKSVSPTAVPEPATLLGFGIPMCMVGLGKLRRLRK